LALIRAGFISVSGGGGADKSCDSGVICGGGGGKLGETTTELKGEAAGDEPEEPGPVPAPKAGLTDENVCPPLPPLENAGLTDKNTFPLCCPPPSSDGIR